ncbi:hypothetical protein [Montanilutibacter psychrotolerans]|uniref:Thioredoxin domain-containing protein n=1 Tax=Montanilutibacter psychrotolerans TaxID=1327343 RepID=A0A3M8SQD1_9GAMM|nr:hypothetical protein [Lysobacter psychrotolerans]RNF82905.1 hypothetical protein EER27_13465 [Lysobacter psychrotolerans]
MDVETRPLDSKTRNRNRGLLIAIFMMFFGSMLVAGVLRFTGWMPEGRKNFGEMLQPPSDIRELSPALVGGGDYAWNRDARTWRIVVAAPAECDAACAKLAHDLDTVWRLFGKDADRVHVLWLCDGPACMPPASVQRPRTLKQVRPDPRLSASLPRLDDPKGLPVYVIDPNGFVILRYAPGFDPAGLRADLAKLLKLA